MLTSVGHDAYYVGPSVRFPYGVECIELGWGDRKMIDGERLGERLRKARKLRRLSQRTVSRVLDLPRTAVTNIENGHRRVSTLELTQMAELYRLPVTHFIRSEDSGERDISSLVFCEVPEMKSDSKLNSAVFCLLELCREGTTLRRLLGLPVVSNVPEYASVDARRAVRHGEEGARAERERLGLGNRPLRDIAEVISQQNVWTASVRLPSDLSGVFLNHPEVGAAIFVNRNHHPVRQLFSYAHEYAHALFDRSEVVIATRRDDRSEPAEVRANAFAAAFLMPPEGIGEQLARLDKGGSNRREHTYFDVAGGSAIETKTRSRPGSQAITWQDAATIAWHFGVSFEATIWRLQNIGHVNRPQGEELLAQKDSGRKYMKWIASQRHWDAGPSASAAKASHGWPELSMRLVHLMIEAYRQQRISRGRLLELARRLGMRRSTLLELALGTQH